MGEKYEINRIHDAFSTEFPHSTSDLFTNGAVAFFDGVRVIGPTVITYTIHVSILLYFVCNYP